MQALMTQLCGSRQLLQPTYTPTLPLQSNTYQPFAEDPAIFIADKTLYAVRGSTKEIAATVFTSSQSSLTVAWYHQGTLLDPSSNSRYSVSMEDLADGRMVYTLNVLNVDRDVLGEYSAVVTVDVVNDTDTVQLMHPGRL